MDFVDLLNGFMEEQRNENTYIINLKDSLTDNEIQSIILGGIDFLREEIPLWKLSFDVKNKERIVPLIINTIKIYEEVFKVKIAME
jgi:hypothetical protein